MHYHHANAWVLNCPMCESTVVAIMVLPTDKRTIYVIGSCVQCHYAGRKPTIVFEYIRSFVKQSEWEALLAVPYLPVGKSDQ